MFLLGVMEYQDSRSDFFSTAFGARVMENISSFLAGNNCNLDALLSDTMESASALGERLLTELRRDPDAAKHKSFEENFVNQLGVYCATRRSGEASTAQMQLQPNLLKSFEGMAVSSISRMLLNAKLESVSGVAVCQRGGGGGGVWCGGGVEVVVVVVVVCGVEVVWRLWWWWWWWW
jgi:hypothetical protein